MNNIKDIIHLFQKVEDGLPENKDWYYCLKANGIQSMLPPKAFDKNNITHWLDLSKLTTKERKIIKTLPEFLYEDNGEIKIGRRGDSCVTDEWNKYLNSL